MEILEQMLFLNFIATKKFKSYYITILYKLWKISILFSLNFARKRTFSPTQREITLMKTKQKKRIILESSRKFANEICVLLEKKTYLLLWSQLTKIMSMSLLLNNVSLLVSALCHKLSISFEMTAFNCSKASCGLKVVLRIEQLYH